MYIKLEVSDRYYEDYEDYKYYKDYGVYEEKVPSNLPKPDFMPMKLVRVSDMVLVNGSQVNEGYCALSYSWNQSGEILRDEATGKYKRIDEGKHMIISYFNIIDSFKIFPDCKTFYNDKLWKLYEVLEVMHNNTYIAKIEYVKFEGIIQYICQQFNIKYIWYDQMCINQDNEEEKLREIRNMHLIYSNAYCAVALVPEYKYGVLSLGLNGEEYFKRLWTLEEALKSNKKLFIGGDLNCWCKDIPPNLVDSLLSRQVSELNVAQILYQAHQRTSTKDHDRVFALIHLFPEFLEHINIDYDQPLEDLMIRFYGLLAKKDISILLFEKIENFYNSTIQKYKFLPSWTGVNGLHIPDDVTTSFQVYDIIGKTMQVTSKFVTTGQLIDNDALTIRKEDLPPPPADIKDGTNKYDYCLCTSIQLPGTSETKIMRVMEYNSFYSIAIKEKCLDGISKYLKLLSRFLETKKENLYWCHRHREEYQKAISINLNSLTEDADNLSAQYTILSEVSFKDKYDFFIYPVIKKKQGEEYYKAIGCCKIRCNEDIFSDCKLPKQTFSIQ